MFFFTLPVAFFETLGYKMARQQREITNMNSTTAHKKGSIIRYGRDEKSVCRLLKECGRYQGGWHATLLSGEEGIVLPAEISPASVNDVKLFNDHAKARGQ